MRRLSLLLLLLAGCDLYWNGGGDDVCNQGGTGLDGDPVWEGLNLRNPSSGQCEIIGGGPGPCDSACGPCPETASLPPVPDWGACFSDCSNLGPDDCMAASGCRAVYNQDSSTALTDFLGCWAVAPSGPIEGGSCLGLDAWSCSQHDDCSAVYGANGFVSCKPEQPVAGCGGIDCGPGSHCEEQCYPCDSTDGTACPAQCQSMCVPDQDACAAADCGPGYQCVQQCDPMDPTAGGGVGTGQCYPTCVPTGGGDPGSCTGAITCGAPAPACPAGTTAGILNGCYSGYCIPNTDCGPLDPGTCGEPVTCDSNGPSCPAGTQPGIKNGCYSGYCIPDSQCPQAACEVLPTEGACTARGDCTPVYEGSDCTCYPGYCECQTLTYERCESTVMAL